MRVREFSAFGGGDAPEARDDADRLPPGLARMTRGTSTCRRLATVRASSAINRARRVHNGSDLHGTFSLRLNKAAQQSAQAFVRPWR
ncbi:hypothetical protein MINTM008_43090 [Mycobacterium intracellulare]|nr:hypothetical protein MINTM006_40950 [Mycobacterium intracellulare]BCO74974.1 hypothetical protein MINTM008_43090 [Mycobacterium intracellulare]BCO80430.1 hypothetical protein MINTM009_42120 [Mycobacterium intracellulare]BCP27776.1 hypothetical protein MINTM025_41320 [Mycobacterium intracellulare]